jgi:hypothetical protein
VEIGKNRLFSLILAQNRHQALLVGMGMCMIAPPLLFCAHREAQNLAFGDMGTWPDQPVSECSRLPLDEERVQGGFVM